MASPGRGFSMTTPFLQSAREASPWQQRMSRPEWAWPLITPCLGVGRCHENGHEGRGVAMGTDPEVSRGLGVP